MGLIEWEGPTVTPMGVSMICDQEDLRKAPRPEVTVWEASLEVTSEAEGTGRMLEAYELPSTFQS